MDLNQRFLDFCVPAGLKCLGGQFMKHQKLLGAPKDLIL